MLQCTCSSLINQPGCDPELCGWEVVCVVDLDCRCAKSTELQQEGNKIKKPSSTHRVKLLFDPSTTTSSLAAFW